MAKQVEPTFKNSTLANIYEYAGLFIIVTATSLFLYQAFKLIRSENKLVPEVKIEKKDSINFGSRFLAIKKRNKIDSLLESFLQEREQLKDSIASLNKKVELVTIDNSDTESKVKTVASIMAVIVAIVGFFGFKSLNDVREHTIKNSQIDSQKIAKETSKSIAEESVKKILESYRSKVADLEPLIKEVENSLANRIGNVEEQISTVEENIARMSNRVKVLEDNEDGGMDGSVVMDNGDDGGGGPDKPIMVESEGNNIFNTPEKKEHDVPNTDVTESDSDNSSEQETIAPKGAQSNAQTNGDVDDLSRDEKDDNDLGNEKIFN